MMNKMSTKSWVAGLALLTFAACSDNNDNPTPDVDAGANDKFVIASVSGSATYSIPVSLDVIEKDTTITTNVPGTIESDVAFTQFAHNGTNAVVSFNYRQGSPAPGVVFQLSSTGQLRLTDQFILQNWLQQQTIKH
jgi:hypothetical protein